MFVLSGIMVVIAFTLIIVFNARLLTTLFQRKNGHKYRKPALIAAVAVAIAATGVALGDAGDGAARCSTSWPASSASPRRRPGRPCGSLRRRPPSRWASPTRSRTASAPGMTIAMFSLIVFSIVTFSAVNANFTRDDDGRRRRRRLGHRGDRQPQQSRRRRRRRAPRTAAPSCRGLRRCVPAARSTFTGSQQVLHDGEFLTYPVIAGDDAFYARTERDAGRSRGRLRRRSSGARRRRQRRVAGSRRRDRVGSVRLHLGRRDGWRVRAVRGRRSATRSPMWNPRSPSSACSVRAWTPRPSPGST